MRNRRARDFCAAASVFALASVAGAQAYPGAVDPSGGVSGADAPSAGGVPGAPTTGAGAERLIYGADAGFGQTDNVNLAATNKVAQTIATVDGDFDIKHRSSRLDVDAKGYLYDYEYLQGAYGNELLGRVDGVARVALIPQRITWVLQDDFGQATIDPFVPTTPGNYEHINYVSTGPDFALRLGGTGFLDAGVRIARAIYQTSPLNSSRALGNIAAGLQLSPRSTISLNGSAERVLFDNTLVNGNFTRTSAYLRYQIQGARTGISVDLGETRISQNGSAGTNTIALEPNGKAVSIPVTIPQSAYTATGPLARISLTRNLSSDAAITLSGGRDLIDGTSSFSSVQGGVLGVSGTAGAALTSSSYTHTYGTAGWQYVRNRTKIGLSANWERDIYVSQPQFDLKRVDAEVSVSRKLSRAFALQVVGRYDKNDYPNPGLLLLAGGSPKFDDTLAAAVLSWRHSRALELRLRAEHSSRTAVGGYGENRVFLTVGYRPWAEDPLSGASMFDSASSMDSQGFER